VNQIGTVTKSIQAALNSKDVGWGVMVSHRSGETEDNFITNLSRSTILKMEVAVTLHRSRIQDLGVLLMGSGYEVFFVESALYGFKGLAGRLAPIGVHGALLLIMAGATLNSIGGYRGSVTVPQGLNFIMGDVLAPNGIISRPIPDFQTEVHVDKFYIDYYDN
ncbi:hypothetical protein KI387_031943, partial [Taxus chinensis]